MSKKLLIVESPSKASTIQGYLGKEFEVIASKGHVRQLCSKNGSVKIENGIEFVWETQTSKVKEIYSKLSDKSEIILATDMDREGEAISYHLKTLISQYLSRKKVSIPISRISFFEITKKAIFSSLENKRDVDKNLVNAYLTRVALDYSVGYQLSPQLWKNLRALGRNQSAGRVQSSALKIIAQREKEILNFKKEKFFSVEAQFSPANITANLFSYKEEKIDPKNKESLEKFKFPKSWKVKEIRAKNVTVPTPSPFITSSLQQEASSRLGIKIEIIMKIAQSLYEGVNIDQQRKALITYMRTDSTNISQDALDSIRGFVKINYPDLYTKEKKYASKVKNAQEAHECIRAIDVNMTPESVESFLTPEQYDLYHLIWSRTVACQMKDAIRNQVSLDIASEDFIFRASFSKIESKGFLSFLRIVEDTADIPSFKQGDELQMQSHKIVEHTTNPPTRYGEASLIKQCESYGIGRPSTYVPIINTLIKREYVKPTKRSFEISFRGMIVYFFLEKFFSKYVDLSFTSHVEDMLDQIANGTISFEEKIIDFIQNLQKDTENIQQKDYPEILEGIESLYESYEDITCPECKTKMKMKMSFYFTLHCENCKYSRRIGERIEKVGEFEIVETEKYKAVKCGDKNIYLPQNFKGEVTEEIVAFIVTLPKFVYKKNNEDVTCGMSKFGFYLKYLNAYYSFEMTQLMELISTKNLETLDELLDEKISYKQKKDLQTIKTKYGPCRFIETSKYRALKTKEKTIYLPKTLTCEINVDTMEYLLSLPKDISSGKRTGEIGMNKFGFFLKMDKNFFSFDFKFLY